MKKLPPAAPETCPVCDEAVPRGALACPECGADHNSGWRENADLYDGLDLPDDGDFDHREFADREFGDSASPTRIPTIYWMTAIGLIVITFVYLCLR